MKTKTIRQTVTFNAAPLEVYEMLMDSKKHKSLSGEEAKISRKVGGPFTSWGKHLSGINLVLKPGERIVQAWRATGWWPDYYSIAIFELERVLCIDFCRSWLITDILQGGTSHGYRYIDL